MIRGDKCGKDTFKECEIDKIEADKENYKVFTVFILKKVKQRKTSQLTRRKVRNIWCPLQNLAVALCKTKLDRNLDVAK